MSMMNDRRHTRLRMLRHFAHVLLDRGTTRKRSVQVGRNEAIVMSVAMSSAADRIQELETALRLAAPSALEALDSATPL